MGCVVFPTAAKAALFQTELGLSPALDPSIEAVRFGQLVVGADGRAAFLHPWAEPALDWLAENAGHTRYGGVVLEGGLPADWQPMVEEDV